MGRSDFNYDCNFDIHEFIVIIDSLYFYLHSKQIAHTEAKRQEILDVINKTKKIIDY